MSGPDPLRVLVVDDSDDDFELIVRAMHRDLPSRIEARRVEAEAPMREALGEGPWHVVLVDWVLPGFSAPQALAVMAEQRCRVPCIVVSGMTGEEIAVLAIKLGAVDFVRKDRLELLGPTVQRELLFAAADEGESP